MSLYLDLLHRLFQTNLIGGMKLGLSNSLKMQHLLDFPDRSFPTVHIAGTNGKGSVAIKIASTLEAAGYRTALYTSPHLSCFRERIRINGQMISEESVSQLLQQLYELVDTQQIPATFFELTTFLALLYFQQEKVDVAVIETGLGGRLDATNVISPSLSVITSISIDHSEILGKSIEEITREKAGIIKPSIPVVIGPHVPVQVIQEITRQLQCEYSQVTHQFSFFEEENCAIAKEALRKLSAFFTFSESDLKKGLKNRQPCRFEKIEGDPLIILDVAHNPGGLIALFQAIRKQYGNKELRIVFGLSSNKDWAACLEILAKYGQYFHLVAAPNGRGTSTEKLSQELLPLLLHPSSTVSIHDHIENGVKEAQQEAKAAQQILVICGTFFIMEKVRKTLGYRDPSDKRDMNERIIVDSPYLKESKSTSS
jgi:dihydrofolate synthase/folylpolyglutamate synthase